MKLSKIPRQYQWRNDGEGFGTGARMPLTRESMILAMCVHFVHSVSSFCVQNLNVIIG